MAIGSSHHNCRRNKINDITTPQSTAVVQYFDPIQNRVVVENYPIGGFGASRISILTGVPAGSPSSVGEVSIGIVNSGALIGATGAGLLARSLGRLAGGLTGSDSLRESSQFRVYLGSILNTEGGPRTEIPIPDPRDQQCFLAGTPIDMWDGSKKPIEEITPDDTVISFDEHGKKVPGKVTRTFQNHSKHILDLHGLMITPGHAVYCAKVEEEENRFAGKYVPIMDILRTDGAIQHEDGTLVRASTGAIVGSFEDQMISVVVGTMDANGHVTAFDQGIIRLGTKYIKDDGTVFCIADIAKKNGLEVAPDGKLTSPISKDKDIPYLWSLTSRLPKPEDYVLQRSALTLDEIYQADEWDHAFMPQMPAPMQGEAGLSFKRDNTMYAGGATASNDHLPPNIPHSTRNSPDQPTMTRKQRRAYEAKQRKVVKVNRTVRATVQ